MEGNSDGNLSVIEVARYFLMKDSEPANSEKKSIDKSKLQKLCHYAQDYYTAQWRVHLFSEQVSAYTCEPCYAELNEKYKEYEIGKPILWDSVIDPIDLTKYSLSVRLHLDTIFELDLQKGLKASELSRATHDVDPCKTDTNNGKETSLYDSYLEILFFNIKKYVNNHAKIEDLSNIHEDFSNIENVLSNLSDTTYQTSTISHFISYQWPEQSLKDSIISSIFFPKELEENQDIDVFIYQKQRIHFALAFSAKHGGRLAYYHLARIIEHYNSNENDDIRKVMEFFDSYNNIDKLSENKTDNIEELQNFSLGVLFLYLNTFEKAKDYFKKAEQLSKALYYSAMLEEEQQQVALYQRAYNNGNGEPRALLGLARTAEDINQTFERYLEAGKSGIAEGYYQIGILLDKEYIYRGSNNDLKKDSIYYLEEAGKMGMLSAYDTVADIYKTRTVFEKAKECYTEKAKRGNLFGYYSLAEILEQEGKMHEAQEAQKKAYFDQLGHFRAIEGIVKGGQE